MLSFVFAAIRPAGTARLEALPCAIVCTNFMSNSIVCVFPLFPVAPLVAQGRGRGTRFTRRHGTRQQESATRAVVQTGRATAPRPLSNKLFCETMSVVGDHSVHPSPPPPSPSTCAVFAYDPLERWPTVRTTCTRWKPGRPFDLTCGAETKPGRRCGRCRRTRLPASAPLGTPSWRYGCRPGATKHQRSESSSRMSPAPP